MKEKKMAKKPRRKANMTTSFPTSFAPASAPPPHGARYPRQRTLYHATQADARRYLCGGAGHLPASLMRTGTKPRVVDLAGARPFGSSQGAGPGTALRLVESLNHRIRALR